MWIALEQLTGKVHQVRQLIHPRPQTSSPQVDETLQGVGYGMSGRKPWVEAFGGILEHLLNKAALRATSEAVRRELAEVATLKMNLAAGGIDETSDETCES